MLQLKKEKIERKGIQNERKYERIYNKTLLDFYNC